MLLDPGSLGGVDSDCHAAVEGPEECEEEAGGLGAVGLLLAFVVFVCQQWQKIWQILFFWQFF